MAKEIVFDVESRDRLKKGVDALANAVKVDIHLLRCARITIGFAPASYGSFFRMSEEINPL
jgi:hypothetical protein